MLRHTKKEFAALSCASRGTDRHGAQGAHDHARAESWEMNAKPNSYLDVAVLQPKTLNALELMRANKAGNPKEAPLEQRAIKRRSSLTVSCRPTNR
jgi:hypothetical protein